MDMLLEGHILLTARLVCLTGLRVGGGHERTEIGGVDNPIIKNPLTDEPYIPGSSIKGKIRSLIEWELGKVTDKGKPCDCASVDCPVCRVFGIGGYKVNPDLGPSRVIFRDCHFTEAFRAQWKALTEESGLQPIEEKRENVINRRRGVATLPRVMERIPAGAEFKAEISYRVFACGQEGATRDIALYQELLRGLKYLEEDALGGSGSRGYGRITFRDVKLDFSLKNAERYAAETEAVRKTAAELFEA
jgi:CRISPR-associated protein Csm3